VVVGTAEHHAEVELLERGLDLLGEARQVGLDLVGAQLVA
jgi:hypothetical protein